MGAVALQHRDRLTLEDREGRLRIELLVHPDWGPTVRLYDNAARERLRLGSDQNRDGTPYIAFFKDDPARPVKIIWP
jgi:hypothetical protein